MIHPELPNNNDAEAAIIGSVWLRPDSLDEVATWLKPEHFYDARHRLIYRAMLACLAAREPANSKTVLYRLQASGDLEAVGGIAALLAVGSDVPTSGYIEHYARIVETAALRRRVIAAGQAIAQLGFDEQVEPDDMIASALSTLNSASDRAGAQTIFYHLSDIAEHEIASVMEDSPAGIPTGFADFDSWIGGLYPGDLDVLAGRTSMGKTSLALSLVYNLASSGRRALMYSLEMGREQLFQRLASMRSGINLELIRKRHASHEQVQQQVDAMVEIAPWPVTVADISRMDINALRLHTLRYVTQYPDTQLIVIDYLQLLTGTPNRRDSNRVQEVSEISRSLKALAREINLPVLALSQLSRAVEGRASHVPMLSDLRESGSIEQDSDVVMFVYRDDYYNPETDKKGITDLYVAKNRNGSLGVVPLRFDAPTTRFHSLDYRTVEGY